MWLSTKAKALSEQDFGRGALVNESGMEGCKGDSGSNAMRGQTRWRTKVRATSSLPFNVELGKIDFNFDPFFPFFHNRTVTSHTVHGVLEPCARLLLHQILCLADPCC